MIIIRNHRTGKVLHKSPTLSLRVAVELAIAMGTRLCGADLSWARLDKPKPGHVAGSGRIGSCH